MTLILLGTQDKPFNRLLDEVLKLKEKGKINDKVVAQIGCTKFISDKIKTLSFVSREEYAELIDSADLIISHAGVGTITDCIKKGKKVIVVPRLKEYKEHTNDHQIQITKEFEEKGYVLAAYDTKDLGKVVKKLDKFKVKKYQSNNENFKEKLKEYIDSI